MVDAKLSSADLLRLCAEAGLDAAAVVDLLRDAAGHGERAALEVERNDIEGDVWAGCDCPTCRSNRRRLAAIDAALNRQQSFLAALLADPGTTEDGLRKWLPEAITKAREVGR